MTRRVHERLLALEQARAPEVYIANANVSPEEASRAYRELREAVDEQLRNTHTVRLPPGEAWRRYKAMLDEPANGRQQ